MPATIVFVFPGQNSRDPAMIERLLEADAENRRIARRASDIVGRDLTRHFTRENPDAFTRNRDVQVGVFLANYLIAGMLERAGVTADRSAGLSLGEYNHLVDIGALTFEAALPLLEARGDAYDSGPHGVMTAVFPISADEAAASLAPLLETGALALAMRNTPRQQVLSGARTAVQEAVGKLEDEHFVQHVVIDDRLPMHSPLFTGVGAAFRPCLEAVAWRVPARSYLPNVTGRALEPSVARNHFVDLLTRHVSEPVWWQNSVDHLASLDDSVFVEVGPGDVLFNMLTPRWTRRQRYKSDSATDLAGTLKTLTRELGHGH